MWPDPITSDVPSELKQTEILSVFVDSKITSAVIDALPELKHVALRSTGYDHVDVAYAQQKGISVSYVPHYGSQTVAEHTFALMLELSRKVSGMYSLLRTTGAVSVEDHEGFDLNGKTLGIIGTGAIGRRVAEIANGFHMKVVAYDPNPNPDLEEMLTYDTLDYVLSQSDFITLHVPLFAETHHILNEQTLKLSKPGSYVINTARGSLIDTVALIHSLKSGHTAGAGLDVYEGEEFLRDELKLIDSEQEHSMQVWRAFAAEHELLDMPNVVMTPHMAFNTKEAKREITETTVENINHFTKGEEFFKVEIPT
jgi:D-lactate dehydrogenase